MTPIEKQIADRLMKCRFLPGSFDKKFVSQLPNWSDRELTKGGRTTLYRLYQKYRRQITDYNPNILDCNLNTNP